MRIRARVAGLAVTYCVALALTAPAAAAPLPGDFFGLTAPDSFDASPAFQQWLLRDQKAVGGQVVRQIFDWSRIEPARGSYDWGPYDSFMTSTSQAGMDVLATVAWPAAWASRCPSGPNPWTCPPASYADFGRFVAALIGRYGPEGSFWTANPSLPKRPIEAWQLWNEPNLRGKWGSAPNAAEYAEMLKAAAPYIRAADPNAEIVSAGVPNSYLSGAVPMTAYLEGMYAAGAQGAFDTLGLHIYCETPACSIGLVESARSIMNAHGDEGAPIWVTEMGWASAGRAYRFVTDLEGQAANISELMGELVARHEELGVRGLVQYMWHDLSPQTNSTDSHWNHVGLTDVDYTHKPAWTAYRSHAIAGSALSLSSTPATAAAVPPLEAGVGKADITPPTGYLMLGWARGDARAMGQQTRLYARAMVLRRGARRLVLVSEDLNMVAGGMVQQAARSAGFGEREVIVQASHTHAGPTGYSNFLFKDRAFPTPKAPKAVASEPDPRLYTFMVHRLALAIRRANADRRPAAAAWGTTRLLRVTRNRSIEAHLADHGVERAFGTGKASEDPLGRFHPIDAGVNVLRVDQLRGGRRVPVGAWAVFANHGTVNKSTFQYYNGDHGGVAHRVFEAALRRAGRVGRGRDVVLVYGNGAAGDVSAGLDRSGPAAAEWVGRREADAMLSAWRAAGRRLSRTPALASRWTRVCFCGQPTPFGRLADSAVFGQSYLTGSEEGRGPAFDATGVALEGSRLDAPVEPQGRKIPALTDPGHTLEPTAVPLTAARIGDRVLVSVPGEMTVELARRTRAAAVRAMAGSGLQHVVVAGYANEYVSYLTTPEEYEAQHYEGGTTVYGPASGAFVASALGDLAGRLARGVAAPAPYPFDPTRGLRPDGPAYPRGASAGRAVRQPRAARRLGRPSFSWRGGADGLDRPLDRAFVSVQRRSGGRWHTVDDDRGLRILWRIDDDRPQELGTPVFDAGRRGTYRAWWEAPRQAPVGTYRFVVTATRYRLASRSFALRPARSLRLAKLRARPGLLALVLRYPAAVPERDLTIRPGWARAGTVTVYVGGRRRVLPLGDGGVLALEPGRASVRVRAGGARDRYGNVNGRAFSAP